MQYLGITLKNPTDIHCRSLWPMFAYMYVDFCACPSKNVVELNANGKKACCHVAGAFLSKLELICPISSLQNLQNVQKIRIRGVLLFAEPFFSSFGFLRVSYSSVETAKFFPVENGNKKKA